MSVKSFRLVRQLPGDQQDAVRAYKRTHSYTGLCLDPSCRKHDTSEDANQPPREREAPWDWPLSSLQQCCMYDSVYILVFLSCIFLQQLEKTDGDKKKKNNQWTAVRLPSLLLNLFCLTDRLLGFYSAKHQLIKTKKIQPEQPIAEKERTQEGLLQEIELSPHNRRQHSCSTSPKLSSSF